MAAAKTAVGGARRKRAAQRTQDPEGREAEHHRDRVGGVRAQRPVGRADRRDRGPHALQQADDLLLFRRQGGALPRALENAYRLVREGEASSTSRTCRRSRRCKTAGRVHLRPPPPARGFHPHGDDREHPPRRVSRAVQGHPAAQRLGDRHDRERLQARRRRRQLSARGSTRSSSTGRSARSASSTSPTARRSRRFSAAISGHRKRWRRCATTRWRWCCATWQGPVGNPRTDDRPQTERPFWRIADACGPNRT